jgi:hypothetical protein
MATTTKKKKEEAAKVSETIMAEVPAGVEVEVEAEAHELVPHTTPEGVAEDSAALKDELFKKTTLQITLTFWPLEKDQTERAIYIGSQHRDEKPVFVTNMEGADFSVWPQTLKEIIDGVKEQLYAEHTKKVEAQAEETRKMAETKAKTDELIAKNQEANASKPAGPTKPAKAKDTGPQMSLFDEF